MSFFSLLRTFFDCSTFSKKKQFVCLVFYSDADSSDSEIDTGGKDGSKINGEKICNGIPTSKQGKVFQVLNYY